MREGLLNYLGRLLFGDPVPCHGCVTRDAAMGELRRLALEERTRSDAREKRLADDKARLIEIIQGTTKQFAELAAVRLAIAAADPKRPREPNAARYETPMVPGIQSLYAGGHIEVPPAQREYDRTGIPPALQEMAKRPLTPDEQAIFERAQAEDRPPAPGEKLPIGLDVVGPR